MHRMGIDDEILQDVCISLAQLEAGEGIEHEKAKQLVLNRISAFDKLCVNLDVDDAEIDSLFHRNR